MIGNHSHKDIEDFIEQLLKFEKLTETQIFKLCEKAKEVLAQEENVVYVNAPVTVCGNICGQFQDLMELFLVSGKIPDTNYLFLGNYVKGGDNGIETMSLLLSYKLRFPKRITLLRGHGEIRFSTQGLGFYDECKRKYGSAKVWTAFNNLFDYLPLAAVVENSFYCIHSGLSPKIHKIDQLKSLERVQEPSCYGPMKDILMNEPGGGQDWSQIYRSRGFYFGEDITEKFNYKNNIKMICRGHDLAMEVIFIPNVGLFLRYALLRIIDTDVEI